MEIYTTYRCSLPEKTFDESEYLNVRHCQYITILDYKKYEEECKRTNQERFLVI